MKYGNSALLFLVFCSVGGYVCGMSDTTKPAWPKRPFAFSPRPSTEILGIQPATRFLNTENSQSTMLEGGRERAECRRKKESGISSFVSKKSETTQQTKRKAMSESTSPQARHQAAKTFISSKFGSGSLGKTLIFGDNDFSCMLESSREKAQLKRKPLSELSATVTKKSETTQQVQRKAVCAIATQPASQTAEEKLLAVCNAQSKQRGLGITLMPFPKDLVVDVTIENRFLEERIVPPSQNRRLTQSENDALIGLMGVSYGQELTQCI